MLTYKVEVEEVKLFNGSIIPYTEKPKEIIKKFSSKSLAQEHFNSLVEFYSFFETKNETSKIEYAYRITLFTNEPSIIISLLVNSNSGILGFKEGDKICKKEI